MCSNRLAHGIDGGPVNREAWGVRRKAWDVGCEAEGVGREESGRRSGDTECEERDVTPHAPMTLVEANHASRPPESRWPRSAFVTLKAA